MDGYDLCTNIHENEGRGIAVYTADRLASRANQIEMVTDFKESIWIQLNVSENTKLTLGCVYRSPSSSIENDGKLHQLLANVNSNRDSSQVIIIGDLNHPEIDWETMTTIQCVQGMNHSSQLLIDAIRDAYI